MDEFREIGVVFENLRRFEWKIDNFRSLFEDRNVEYRSPAFWACQNKWVMVLSLHDVFRGTQVINMQLFRKTYLDEEEVQISLGVKRADGTDLVLSVKTQILTDGRASLDKLILASHSFLESHEEEWMSSGALTIFWVMCVDYPDLDRDSEENTDDGWESMDEAHVEKENAEIEGNLEKESCLSLQRDMLEMLENRLDADVIILVHDCRFSAHQCILTVRSRLFQRVLCENKENKDTKHAPRLLDLSSDDLQPWVFRKFLEFAYTGKVWSLTVENAAELLDLGYKLDSPDLRILCSKYLYANMTPAVVIKVLVSNLQKERKLYSKAMRIFQEHTSEVLEGEAWREILMTSPVTARQILESAELPASVKEPVFEVIRQKMVKAATPNMDLITQAFSDRNRLETHNVQFGNSRNIIYRMFKIFF